MKLTGQEIIARLLMNMKAARPRLLIILMAFFLIFSFGCNCETEDNRADGPPLYAADDDSTDDDDIQDDDDAQDDDDDDDDDDSFPPPDSFGWILMDTDRAYISQTLNKAADFGITHIQLSHALIMDIDEINLDPVKAALLKDIAREAHDLGLDIWVWAHEIYGVHPFACFDPQAALWESRAQAYRDALDAIPEIDGVILMFGSADTEPWYVVCACQWCQDLPSTGNFILDFMNNHPAERLTLLYDVVGGVVMDEYGKKLRVRTFMHMPWELDWLSESLVEYDRPDLMVMSKDVPQVWVPYYPHNPIIGLDKTGGRHQIIEMDLGNEYWGKNKILSSQVDYINYRWSYDKEKGAMGAAARIERGANHAFGTANEINIYAFSRIVRDSAKPDAIYREWFEERYGIGPPSPASDALKEIFRNSHFAMRKMYYTLGMWTLEKGSDLTDSARFPSQLWTRSTAFYDKNWIPVFRSLAAPTTQTLSDLWQEGAEAMEIAADNLAALESIETAFANANDYDELRQMLDLQVDCAAIWRLADDVVYRYLHKITGHPENDPFLEWNARKLLVMADDMEQKWGPNISPGNPARIRNFVADLRAGFPDYPTAAPYEQTEIFDVWAEELGGGIYQIRWSSSAPMTSFVEWSDKLPQYENSSGEVENFTTEHSILMEVESTELSYVFRVGGHDGGGALIRTGDFWIGLDLK